MMNSVIDVSGEDRFEHGPSEFPSKPYPGGEERSRPVAHAQDRKVVWKSFGDFFLLLFSLSFLLLPLSFPLLSSFILGDSLMLLSPDPVTRIGLWLARDDDGDLTRHILARLMKLRGVPTRYRV